MLTLYNQMCQVLQSLLTKLQFNLIFTSSRAISRRLITSTPSISIHHLPQSKSYLKIIDVPYFPHNNLNKCLTPNDIENIIKQNQFLTILFSHQNYTSLRFHLSLICQSFGLTFGMFRVAVRLRVL